MARTWRARKIAQDDFKLIFLQVPPESQPFTSPSSGGGPSRQTPVRQRAEHAKSLLAKFDQAWSAPGERDAVAFASRSGVYLEFESFSDDLPLKSLEDVQAGIRLLNVRVVETDNGERKSLATVYVPKPKAGSLIKKITDYRDKESASGKPKNEKLISRIDDIRSALVSSFWTDDPLQIPTNDPKWVEVWLATDDEERVNEFRAKLAELELQEHPRRGTITFPERTVLMVWATGNDLARLVDHSDRLAELRSAREASTFWFDLANADQADWVNDLLQRSSFEDSSGVSVCVLDSGVTAGHPLLQPLMNLADAMAVDPAWGSHDHGRHGTLMSGLAGYGDLQAALESPGLIEVRHRLESVKILPLPPHANAEELWGHVTAQGVYRSEIANPDRKRVICLAVTSTGTRREGRPTSWSAEIDQLAAGVNEASKRLIVVSAGNVREREEWAAYPISNATNSVHDPAQAWNAVTVGASTWKTQIDDTNLAGYSPIAPAGGLSPFSTTSTTWQHSKWPIKPEVVFEGGNAAREPNGGAWEIDDLTLLSTWHDPTVRHFGPFAATSAATALASNFAACIWSEYPQLWPETVRGLMIHSAEWTQSMLDQFAGNGNKTSLRPLLRSCGYGVPSLARATRCLRNHVTLVSEREILPYEKENDSSGSRIITRDLHFYKLPWPADVLAELGGVDVEMRVTLSYFIEPGPGEIGWKERYRYPSAGLRFDINSPGESQDEFLKRINTKGRDEDYAKQSSSASKYWKLGEQRDVGSIHSDIWQGTAVELSASNMIAIFPTIGWWRERSQLGKWDQKMRYSLIVSIRTPEIQVNVDVYTPVASLIMPQIEIAVDSEEPA